MHLVLCTGSGAGALRERGRLWVRWGHTPHTPPSTAQYTPRGVALGEEWHATEARTMHTQRDLGLPSHRRGQPRDCSDGKTATKYACETQPNTTQHMLYTHDMNVDSYAYMFGSALPPMAKQQLNETARMTTKLAQALMCRGSLVLVVL